MALFFFLISYSSTLVILSRNVLIKSQQMQRRRKKCHQSGRSPATAKATSGSMNPKQLILYAKRDILRYAFICLESACRSFPERILELRTVAVPAGNVYMSEVVYHLEKHVCLLVYSLEVVRVVVFLVVDVDVFFFFLFF